jgi:hypothetical protein
MRPGMLFADWQGSPPTVTPRVRGRLLAQSENATTTPSAIEVGRACAAPSPAQLKLQLLYLHCICERDEARNFSHLISPLLDATVRSVLCY